MTSDYNFDETTSFEDQLCCYVLNSQFTIIDVEDSNAILKRSVVFADLSERQIHEIDETLFQDQPADLEDLSLFQNKIERIDVSAFRKLSKLTVLNLSCNRIDKLESAMFDSLPMLRELRVWGNELKRLEPNLFKGLKHLKQLILYQNQLIKIENETFAGLGNLEYLSLDFNKINHIEPNAFESLENLVEIRLNNNQIESIDPRLFEKLVKLRSLFLNTNRIGQIDADTFRTLALLERLDLSSNEIESMKQGALDGLVNLRELDLSENRLDQIYSSFLDALTNLEILDLSTNKIGGIGDMAFSKLLNLRKLRLDSNQLESLGAEQFGESLQHLEELYLNKNRIREIDGRIFRVLCFLKILCLFDNPIEPSKISQSDLRRLSQSIGLVALNYYSDRGRDNDENSDDLVSYFNEAVLEKWNPYALIDVNKSLVSIGEFVKKIGRKWADFNKFLSQFGPVSSLSSSSSSSSSLIVNEVSALRVNNDLDEIVSMMPSTPDIDPYVGRTLRCYMVEALLGEGSYGRVYLVLDLNNGDRRDDNQRKALKVMIDNDDNLAVNELQVLKRLDHVNVLKYFDSFSLNTKSTGNSNEMPSLRKKICIVTEFCEKGDLGREIYRQKKLKTKFSDQRIFKWIFEATCGLKYLHSLNIIHRDIKPQNILLTKNSTVKLADMGSSAIVANAAAAMNRTFVGTLAYMSPEMRKSGDDLSSPYSAKTDIWSLGCVLYELMHFEMAFPKNNSKPKKINLRENFLFSTFLKKMLQRNVHNRIDSENLYQSLKLIKDTLTEEKEEKDDEETIGISDRFTTYIDLY